MQLTRRKLFLAAAAGVLPRVNFAADLKKMIVRSSRPEDLEMPLAGFQDWITPLDRFFVRCHTFTPERPNLNEWRLKLDGVVNQPLSMSIDDLKKLPRVETVAVLECAGNGRSFYQPRVPGTQWAFGSVGNGRWAGVRFRDVLAKAGLKDSAKDILFDGLDVPLGKMQDFQRTIPVKKALDPDTLLAFEMNGQPMPQEHGFPLRLIVPGWAGDSWVKWLQHIEVLDHEFDGFWMKTAYRHPPNPVAPGSAVDPKDMVPVTDLNVKSVIATPDGGSIKPGRARISGTAWSNGSPVAKVDVSVDGGKTWKPATLGKDRSQYAWRLWQLDWTAAEGKHTLMARATNEAGQSQPLSQEWNPSGYLWNVAQPVEVEVSANRAPQTGAAHRAEEQPAGYKAACLTCHDEGMMVQQRLTRAQWDRELNKMTGWGAPIKPEDLEGILKYLSDQFKP
ncbi:MAG TPA: molybdopterin-dependent oxidoreductase [Bryobacteraceae bacterium]|nr:molybdopterin-dependent oxidoreductase [Bryobacteraceae bacterium]